jgi:K+-transporting ATPase ATPase C chain
MLKELRQGLLFTLATMILFGGVYHAALRGIGHVAFPEQAEGSLIQRTDGTIVGSRLIAQRFERGRLRPATTRRRPAAATTGRRILITLRRCGLASTRSSRTRRSPPIGSRQRW